MFSNPHHFNLKQEKENTLFNKTCEFIIKVNLLKFLIKMSKITGIIIIIIKNYINQISLKFVSLMSLMTQ